MHASSVFTVTDTTVLDCDDPVVTALSVGRMAMVKEFTGDFEGRAITHFTYAFDQARGVGTYVALESFEGRLGDRSGTFNLVHSATTDGGPDRLHEFVLIVPASGTGDLAGIAGSGSMSIDADGVHRFAFDYELPGA